MIRRSPRPRAVVLEALEDRIVPSTPVKVQDLGALASSRTAPGPDTLAIGLRPDYPGVAAGDSIIVEVGVELDYAGSGFRTFSASVTDDAGNLYTKDADSNRPNQPGLEVLIFSSHNVKPLVGGQAITVHFDGSGRSELVSASEFTRMAPVGTFDQSSTDAGYSTHDGPAPVTSGFTGRQPAQADELTIGDVVSLVGGSTAPAFAPGPHFHALPGAVVGSGQLISLNPEWSEFATGEATATLTPPSGAGVSWEAGFAAYRSVPQTITSVGPFWVTAGSAGFTLTVSGRDFAANSVVQWNGTALATTFISPTTLQAAVPASLLVEEGPAHVTVFSQGNGTSNVQPFLILPKATLSAPFTASPSVVFFVPAGHALYRHDDSGWVQIGGAGTVLAVSAVSDQSGNVTAFAVTTDHALFRYDTANGWKQIGGKGTILFASAGLDRDGKPDVWVITGDSSLTRWSTSGGWYASPVGAPNTVAAAQANQLGGVYVVTTDWQQNFYGGVWSARLAPTPPPTLSSPAWNGGYLGGVRSALGVDLGPDLRGMSVTAFGITLDDGLIEANVGGEVNTETTFSGFKVRSIRMNSKGAGFWLTTDGNLGGGPGQAPLQSVDDFTAGSQDRLFAVVTDGSVWWSDTSSGWLQLAPPGFGR